MGKIVFPLAEAENVFEQTLSNEKSKPKTKINNFTPRKKEKKQTIGAQHVLYRKIGNPDNL